MPILYIKDEQGKFIPIPALKGDPGDPGKDGKDAAPYTLPTASADTKGGVKVGKGLRMDGDALGVEPEPGLELIETIKIEESGLQGIVRDNIPLLKKLVIGMKTPPYKSTDIFVRATTNKLQNIVVGSMYGDTNYNYSIKFEIGIYDGEFSGTSQGNVSGWGGGNVQGMNSANEIIKAEKDEYIKRAEIYLTKAEDTIPIGTTITIWGVRADA